MKAWYLKRSILKFIIAYLEKCIPFYLSVRFREKKINKQVLDFYGNYAGHENTGIIVQGPVILKDEFTYQTLKLYKHLYPSTIIVFSSWNGQDSDQIKKITQLGIEVILNDKPVIAGTQNVNLQLCSTVSALNFLEAKGNIKYVLKTRSDQRIAKRINFLNFFKELISRFPLADNKVENKLEKRLIVTGLNSFKKRLYGISDMLMFGSLSDMTLYWKIPIQEDAMSIVHSSPKLFMKNKVAEGYFINTFFKSVDHQPLWSEEDSKLFINKFFLIVEKEQIDLFWFKYERWLENYTQLDGSNFTDKKEWNFPDWINNFDNT